MYKTILTLFLALTMFQPALAARPSEVPLEINFRLSNDDSRYSYGLRARLALAASLTASGETERGQQHLKAVEQSVAAMKDGFLFKSGKRVDDAKMAAARDERGYIFGVRRQGNPQKSWTLSALARYYAAQDEIVRAKELIRQIPSDYEQLRAADWLVDHEVQAGRLEQATEYRELVLAEMNWDAREIATVSNLRSNREFQFAFGTAFTLLDAYVKADQMAKADRVATEMRTWLNVLNSAERNPDVGDYRQLAAILVRYYINSDRKPAAEEIAAVCVAKWTTADAPNGNEIYRPNLEYNRPKQLALFDLLVKQPPDATFPLTNANLSRLPKGIPTQFVEIENLEIADPEEARLAYIELGREINADPKRCKRYLQPVIDALVRLGDEPSALELAKELQENLPQQKVKGCPVKAFQSYALRYVDGLDVKPLLASFRVQDEKLTSLSRLRLSGVATAKAFIAAGDMESALRLIDKCSDAATSDDYSMMRSVIALRHEAFNKVRPDEVQRLIAFAQYAGDSRKRESWKRALLSGAARLLVQVERYDWAEQLIDRLAPTSRVEPAS